MLFLYYHYFLFLLVLLFCLEILEPHEVCPKCRIQEYVEMKQLLEFRCFFLGRLFLEFTLFFLHILHLNITCF